MIPFSAEVRRDGTRHRFWKYYGKYCDWSQRPHPPYSNHFPLRYKLERETTDVLTLFRDPRKRLVSAWNNNKHSYGAGKVALEEIREIQTLEGFVAHPNTPGCQTKMMVGKTCSDARRPDATLVAEAKRRVEHVLKFVGLTDSFNASVCLFHHMHGGIPQPYMFQTVGKERSSHFLFHNYSQTKKYHGLPGGGDRVHPDAWMTIDTAADPDDWELYQFARALFVQRLKEYDLWERFGGKDR